MRGCDRLLCCLSLDWRQKPAKWVELSLWKDIVIETAKQAPHSGAEHQPSQKKSRRSRSLIQWLGSIELAVIIIISLGVIIAWGTIVEARFDATAAQKLVYHSVWMYGVMTALSTCLIAVMIDRWPWKAHHTGFVLAHIGIIILIIGSVITAEFGLDGSLNIGIGEKGRHVVVGDTDLTVYTSLDGSSYTKLYDRPAEFLTHSPKDYPIEVKIPTGSIRVVDYLPYAFRQEKIVDAKDKQGGAAVRFQLQNPNVNLIEWLLQAGPGREASKDLGPARVVLTSRPFLNVDGRNTLVLRPKADAKPGEEVMDYEIHSAKDLKHIKKGTIRPGDTVETGWMGIVLRVLKYMPNAKEEISYQPTDAPTPMTTSAIKIDYNGTEQWLGINSLLKLFSDQAVFIVTYANRRIDLGFDLHLKDFSVGRYPGTMQAASYQSIVDVPGIGARTISMNEPLDYKGYTFYQSSFDEDERGQPVASVFTVNRDPGRWIKYLGSLLIVLGSIHLFYFKRRAAKAAK